MIKLCVPEDKICLEVIESFVQTDGDTYDGTYIVDPTFDQQTLNTKSKLMRDDITVNAIEVARTSNLSGGLTVYIGGLING